MVGWLGRKRRGLWSPFCASGSDKSDKQPNTLIKYLLDELEYYEQGHASALRPDNQERDQSLFGEKRHLRPATVNDVEIAVSSLHQHFANGSLGLSRATSTPSFHQSHSRTPGNNLPQSQSTPASPLRISHPLPADSPANWRTSSPGVSGPVRVSESSSIPVSAVPTNLKVPSVPDGVPLSEGWKWWVRDWVKADPSRGLPVALRDWESQWYSGKNRTLFGTVYGQRKRVAIEYYERWAFDSQVGAVSHFGSM